MEGDVYRFGVKDIEITEVAKKAEITEVAEMAEMTEGVRGIRTTTRHVVRPVAEMAEASIKTVGMSCRVWVKLQFNDVQVECPGQES
jgi:hypothetical protein